MANQQIIAYIRQYRPTYYREAIDQELRRQGYSEVDIQSAWDEILQEDARQQRVSQVALTNGRIASWYFFSVGLVLAVIAFILGFSSSTAKNAMDIMIGLVVFITVIGVIGVVFLWNRARSEAKGLLVGVILTAIVVYLPVVALAGICSSFTSYL